MSQLLNAVKVIYNNITLMLYLSLSFLPKLRTQNAMEDFMKLFTVHMETQYCRARFATAILSGQVPSSCCMEYFLSNVRPSNAANSFDTIRWSILAIGVRKGQDLDAWISQVSAFSDRMRLGWIVLEKIMFCVLFEVLQVAFGSTL